MFIGQGECPNNWSAMCVWADYDFCFWKNQWSTNDHLLEFLVELNQGCYSLSLPTKNRLNFGKKNRINTIPTHIREWLDAWINNEQAIKILIAFGFHKCFIYCNHSCDHFVHRTCIMVHDIYSFVSRTKNFEVKTAISGPSQRESNQSGHPILTLFFVTHSRQVSWILSPTQWSVWREKENKMVIHLFEN